MEESAPVPTPTITKTKKTPTKQAKPAVTDSPTRKKQKKNKKTPGKYSQLVINAIQTLGEKNGSSLFKIYNEAKKESWFDKQNGRMYLRYSIRALLLNDTLVQVKGLGANGSFKLNKKKFEKEKKTKKSAAEPTKKVKSVHPAPKKAEAKKKGAKKSTKKSSGGKKKATNAATEKPSVKKTSTKLKKAAAKTPKVAAKKATKAKKST
ncbi:Histone H1x [Triplophysa tibetana]|uniref:Histone H1x n=1 Tax=Triplophysa tibetana TaxID=1572043 RepID=A0A5A9NSC9_9TELE|nr:Histone H1x [Triplophysa tibetana]